MTIDVTATVYWGVASQCDNRPNETADGTIFNPHDPSRFIAVSRDLLELFPYGSIVYIYNCGQFEGYYRVADTMNKRWTKKIDIITKPGVMARFDDVKIFKNTPSELEGMSTKEIDNLLK